MNKILVIGGDQWHPLEIIEKGFRRIPDLKGELEFIEDAKDILTVEKLKEYAVIINCKGNTLISGNPAPWFEETVTEVGPEEIRAYVEQGGSFLSIHAGNSFSEQQVEQQGKFVKPCEQYVQLVGNRFITHPPRCMVSIKNINTSHPIMKDVQEFSARDEHYQIQLLSDDVEILFETWSDTGKPMPGGYTKQLGQGKICVLMPGHTLSVWENQEYQKIVSHAVEWCMDR